MRICLVYDCLFPFTVGGAERWYRNLGERLAREGHQVSYLTLRQWERGKPPEIPGVTVHAVGPRMGLYASGGRRRILPPLVFGAGVLLHLLAFGRRYDVVHTASFPYFSLLAAGAVRRMHRFGLVVDWHEVWSRDYWVDYLGLAGAVGWWVQRLCARLPQRAFCFSRLHQRRLIAAGLRGDATVLEGEYAGPLEARAPEPGEPLVVFAGRHIPEKQVPALIPAIEAARQARPDLHGVIFGDGPERRVVKELIADRDLEEVIRAPGFVAASEVETTLRRAGCMVLPSRREGYGMIVIEAAAGGTPSIVVEGADNAAAELIEQGVNGFVAPSASTEDLSAAILRALDGGMALRRSTSGWFERNAERLSLSSSLARVARAYESR